MLSGLKSTFVFFKHTTAHNFFSLIVSYVFIHRTQVQSMFSSNYLSDSSKNASFQKHCNLLGLSLYTCAHTCDYVYINICTDRNMYKHPYLFLKYINKALTIPTDSFSYIYLINGILEANTPSVCAVIGAHTYSITVTSFIPL